MELMEKGTMTVAFMVYEDFELYSSGVYQHVKGNCLARFVMSCRVMICHIMFCNIMFSDMTSCYVVSCYVM